MSEGETWHVTTSLVMGYFIISLHWITFRMFLWLNIQNCILYRFLWYLKEMPHVLHLIIIFFLMITHIIQILQHLSTLFPYTYSSLYEWIFSFISSSDSCLYQQICRFTLSLLTRIKWILFTVSHLNNLRNRLHGSELPIVS